MEQITRVQIQESLDTYVKTYIADAEWHISLVEDFMHLLTGNSFNAIDLQDSRWIRTIIDNNKDDEYTKKNINAKYAGKIYLWVIQCCDKGSKSWKISMQRSRPPFSVNEKGKAFLERNIKRWMI